MKNLFLALLVSFSITSLCAQLQVETKERQEGTWIENQERWEMLPAESVTTFFEFDPAFKTLKQVSIAETVNYTIKTWNYDEETVSYTMQVLDAADKEHELRVDGLKQFVALFYWKGDTYCLTRFEMTKVEIGK